MNAWFFYCPFVYTVRTRLDSSPSVTGYWILVYLVPTFLLWFSASLNTGLPSPGAAQGFFPGQVANLLLYFLAISLIYTLYEVGYIQNDTETIKKEIHPTLRLNPEQLAYYEQKKYVIYAVRFLTAVVLSAFIVHDTGLSAGSILFLASTWFLIPLYLLYNRMRNRWNLVLHFFLLSLRYSAVLFLFVPEMPDSVLVFSVLIYPLPTILQLCAKGKFGFKKNLFYLKNYNDRYRFRLKYYLLLTAAWWSASLFMPVSLTEKGLLVWFLLFSGTQLLVEKKKRFKTKE